MWDVRCDAQETLSWIDSISVDFLVSNKKYSKIQLTIEQIINIKFKPLANTRSVSWLLKQNMYNFATSRNLVKMTIVSSDVFFLVVSDVLMQEGTWSLIVFT